MTTIQIRPRSVDAGHGAGVTNHTFTMHDVAMAFLASLFVRHPTAGGGSVSIRGNVISFSVPEES